MNSLENLRPIHYIENNSKNDSYNQDDFVFWLATKGVYVVPSH